MAERGLSRGAELAAGRAASVLEIRDAWLVDPASGREGIGTLTVESGTITSVRWRRGTTSDPPPILVTIGFADLHVHVRDVDDSEREDPSTLLAAAARGGFATVCAMANLRMPTDRPARVRRLLAVGQETGSPVRMLAHGTISVDRAGGALAPLASLAAAGAAGFSDDGSPVGDPELLRAALTEAGLIDRVVVEHPEDAALTEDAEANEGLAATLLGLRGAPTAAESSAVARAIAVLRQVVAEAPAECRPRLHLTHLSTAASLELVRAAKREGLPVTCDVTPHHLCLHDGWLGGDRRFAWDAAERPWAGGAADAEPFDPATRVNPPLRSPLDAAALAAGIIDGTVDAIATDHAPHRQVDKEVEFGDALPGISGLETAAGLVLAAVGAGVLPLLAAVRALTSGPWRVLGPSVAVGAVVAPPALRVGAAADLVVIDRAQRQVVDPGRFASRGRNSPLAGRQLPGTVLVTMAAGRIAYADPSLGKVAQTGRTR